MIKTFFDADDVSRILGVSKSYAYKVIRELNDQLKEKGFITVTGKVSSQFFNERFYGMQQQIKEEN